MPPAGSVIPGASATSASVPQVTLGSLITSGTDTVAEQIKRFEEQDSGTEFPVDRIQQSVLSAGYRVAEYDPILLPIPTGFDVAIILRQGQRTEHQEKHIKIKMI